MSTFLLPLTSLVVESRWSLGRVRLHPGADAAHLAPPAGGLPGSGRAWVQEWVDDVLAAGGDATVAEVRDCASIDDAVDDLRTALDVVRLFHLSRRITRTPSFGLPGDVYQASFDYVQVSEGASKPGGANRGDPPGLRMSVAMQVDFGSSPAFAFLGEALSDPEASDGARRAVLGAQFFGQAAREHRPALKALGLVAALEAWLLPAGERGAQTFRLARHVAWFSCGRPDDDLCGRQRPLCPYLKLDPGSGRDRHRLTALRRFGDDDVRWRCSAWRNVLSWYDDRSVAAHGRDLTLVGSRAAGSVEYQVAHHLAEPVLEWLRDHRADPAGDLIDLLNGQPDPPRWPEMLEAIDGDDGSAEPPI